MDIKELKDIVRKGESSKVQENQVVCTIKRSVSGPTTSTQPGTSQDVSQVCPKSVPSWDQVGIRLGLSPASVKTILFFCLEAKKISEIMQEIKLKNRTRFRNDYLKPLLNEGILQLTIPDKPSSPKQKYITSPKGRWLMEEKEYVFSNDSANT